MYDTSPADDAPPLLLRAVAVCVSWPLAIFSLNLLALTTSGFGGHDGRVGASAGEVLRAVIPPAIALVASAVAAVAAWRVAGWNRPAKVVSILLLITVAALAFSLWNDL